jgi:aspartate carbamoyltransferase catalytic subunit
MSRYEGIKFVLISPAELKIPGFIRYNVLERHNIPYTEVTSLDDAMPHLDVLYMTRIQRERFDSQDEYERLKDSYVLTPEKMDLAKPTMRVMHPLPRVNEISVMVDEDPRAAYFRQALNGKYVRMALILKLLDEAKKGVQMPEEEGVIFDEIKCDNPRCITSTEQELRHAFRCVNAENKIYRCIYCEAKKRLD